MIEGQNPLLLLVTFFPMVGFLVILFLRDNQHAAIRWTALVTSLITFVLSLVALQQYWFGLQVGETGLQLVFRQFWANLGGADVSFFFGMDGLNVLLVLLTTFLTPISILSTWESVKDRVRGFMLFFLLLEVGMTGVFLAQDLILFFVFWEFTLVPMYFLIGIWGGPRRQYAAFKFFLYTMGGSILMLLAILWLGSTGGTFSYPDLLAQGRIDPGLQTWLFLAFALAFAVKVPLWPLHSWLPDAHVEAPTAGSVILAGVLLKMGTYGLLRFNLSLFPDATRTLAPWLAGLAVIGILYGAAVSYVQKDMKKLVAFSSVSHLGFVVLGLFALNSLGIQGAILQMVNHGLSTGALFLLVGFIYERRHTRDMDALGGIWRAMPLYGALTLFVIMSSIGLPALNGFIGEFTILVGSYNAGNVLHPIFATLAAVGVILAAVYLLHMFEKVFLGQARLPENVHLKDLNFREIVTLAPILVLILWIGLYPQPFFALISPAVDNLVALLQTTSVALH